MGYTDEKWGFSVVTWSALADECRSYVYYDGVLQDTTTLTALGVWGGVLASTWTAIGSYDGSGPGAPWHGQLAHCAVWDTPLALPAITNIAVV